VLPFAKDYITSTVYFVRRLRHAARFAACFAHVLTRHAAARLSVLRCHAAFIRALRKMPPYAPCAYATLFCLTRLCFDAARLYELLYFDACFSPFALYEALLREILCLTLPSAVFFCCLILLAVVYFARHYSHFLRCLIAACLIVRFRAVDVTPHCALFTPRRFFALISRRLSAMILARPRCCAFSR